MENPWENLKKINNEYIAECDRASLSYLRNSLKGEYELKFGVIPGPYTGDPENSVVYVLALNPGYTAGEDERICAKYEDIYIKNLTHSNHEYPFIPFNPVFSGTPGQKWWKDRLGSIIKETSIETVSKFVFNVEYFPYYSKSYKPLKEILPSQEYTFSLVRKAIKDDKIIILMRSKKIWYKAIDELIDYPNKYILNSPQNTVISQKNIGGEDIFNKIIEKIRNAEKAKK
jgi:hypothetical protein